MSVLPIRDMPEAGILRSRLETDREFLEKIENKLSSKGIITRLFNCTSTRKYEESKLLAAAQILLEEDKEKIPTTITQRKNSIYITFGPLNEPKNEHDQRLQSLENNINTCIAETPGCQNKKWFRHYKKTVESFESCETTIVRTSLKIADLTQRDKDKLIECALL